MPRKFDRDKVIDALMDGQLKQAKKLTLEGLDLLLSDESCVDPQEEYRYMNKMPLCPIRKHQADKLALRVCDVMIRINCMPIPIGHNWYDLMNTYRSLFM